MTFREARPPLTQRDLHKQAVYPPPRYVWGDRTREAALAAEVAQLEFEEAKYAWEQLEYFVIPEARYKLRRRSNSREAHQKERSLDARLAAALKRKEEAGRLFEDATRLHRRLAQRDRVAQQAQEQRNAERGKVEDEAARRQRRLLSLLQRVTSSGSLRDD